MKTIDTSLAGNLRTLSQLSYAFGLTGTAFVVKYFYDVYGAGIKLPAVFHFLPIGAFCLLFSLVLSPAVYKSMVPNLNSLISRGVKASRINYGTSTSHAVLRTVSIIKLIRLVVLCSHPCFLILLAAAVAQYFAA